MGICASNNQGRAPQNSKFVFDQSNSTKSSLIFYIKSWPGSNYHLPTKKEDIIETKMELSVIIQGDKMSIKFNTSSTQNPQGNYLNVRKEEENNSLNCQITRSNDQFSIDFASELKQPQIWQLITSWTQILQEDQIKIGKTHYKLVKLVIENKKQDKKPKIRQANRKSRGNRKTQAVQQMNQDQVCRICLDGQNNEGDPLISPCKCTGTAKYTHMKCLSKWLFDTNSFHPEEIFNIRTNKHTCQICKTDISKTEEYEDMQEFLLKDNSGLPAPYAVLQVCQPYAEHSRDYFIVDFSQKKDYKIGKGRNADIRNTNDRFTSNIHSEIKYRQQKIYLQDCNSTHGTYLRVNKPILLKKQCQEACISYRNSFIKICAPKDCYSL